ncbi:ATP-binding protein [Mucilaginibacter sp. PAMB04168]|uniref:tetratricopeptide repeat-containing sensor histidine kinase n=1 Tax=Mucilaginibacter sp. PAMB04168 TaxID=3138567 RepID=UPI0031F6E88C
MSQASTDYERATSFLDKQIDSAFFYFNRAVISSKDSLQIAMAYNQMAVIQSDASDYFGAQESLSTSLRFLNERREDHHQCLASDYNELGVAGINLKAYRSALEYFDQALRFSKDEKFRLAIFNNKAFTYQEMKAYPQALKIYTEILPKTVRKKTYARILNNMATAKALYRPGYNAAPELLKALEIRRQENDLWGQNSSFTHLADFYAASRPDSALFYANAMYSIARQISSPDDELEALGHLIKLTPTNLAKKYFVRFQRLNDSLVDARNSSRQQFALIRYHAEQSKAENLQLQKENAEKKYQVAVRNLLLFVIVVVIIAVAIIMIVWLRKRKIREEREKQEAILETRRKTSKKVHDSLSNDIYLLMKRIKHDSVLDRQWLLVHSEDVYKRSRDISYEILSDNDEFFHERIGELLKSFGTENTKVSLVGNDEALWHKVGGDVRSELKLILKEFMVNMQKHSKAANVVVKFETKGNNCSITYIDDGVGIPENTIYQNGLTYTGTRIKTICGHINFGTNDGRGLRIEINFPFA